MQQVPLTAVVATIVALGPAIYWLVDLVKDITDAFNGGGWNGVVTKFSAVLAAFGIATLVAHSGLNIGGSGAALATLPWEALLVASIVFAATGGVLSDFLRARNNADSTVKSKLLDK